MIRVGQKVKFDPGAEFKGFNSEDSRGKKVTGTIKYINWRHGWFSVEYNEPKLRTSFMFSQIGAGVYLCN